MQIARDWRSRCATWCSWRLVRPFSDPASRPWAFLKVWASVHALAGAVLILIAMGIRTSSLTEWLMGAALWMLAPIAIGFKAAALHRDRRFTVPDLDALLGLGFF